MISFIDEIKNIRKIRSNQDIVKMSEFVFSIIPQTPEKIGKIFNDDLKKTYEGFKNKNISGWCHANSTFLHLLLRDLGIDSFIYDCGIKGTPITHVVLVFNFKNQYYALDPYFCKYYTDKKGELITYEKLLEESNQRDITVKSVYGKRSKPVLCGEVYEYWPPEKLEKSVLNSWKVLNNYKEIMLENFFDDNPIRLLSKKIEITRVLRTMDGKSYSYVF